MTFPIIYGTKKVVSKGQILLIPLIPAVDLRHIGPHVHGHQIILGNPQFLFPDQVSGLHNIPEVHFFQNGTRLPISEERKECGMDVGFSLQCNITFHIGSVFKIFPQHAFRCLAQADSGRDFRLSAAGIQFQTGAAGEFHIAVQFLHGHQIGGGAVTL